jgi:hypothetical protein
MSKLETAAARWRAAQALPFVAIDRSARSLHPAVKGDETEKSAIAFHWEAAAALPSISLRC